MKHALFCEVSVFVHGPCQINTKAPETQCLRHSQACSQHGLTRKLLWGNIVINQAFISICYDHTLKRLARCCIHMAGSTSLIFHISNYPVPSVPASAELLLCWFKKKIE